MSDMGFSGPEDMPEMGPDFGMTPGPMAGDAGQLPSTDPEFPAAPATAAEVFQEVLQSNNEALQGRLLTDPTPTQQELALGLFVDEIQPQVRDAALMMHAKGYDIGNALHAGFTGDAFEAQAMTLHTPLSPIDRMTVEAFGFKVEADRISFEPEDPTDLGNVKSQWDWLAQTLSDLGEPAGPAMFGNAVAFREAAQSGTLLDYYMPDGIFDPIGTKYVRERDPYASFDLGLSPDPVSAIRELTFIDQYHELGDRLASNPEPTFDELNMGAYKEQLEPQVRDAILTMRAKGYDTGSSGFWGIDHADQAVTIATPIDDMTKLLLAAHNVNVTDEGTIRFSPDVPTDLEGIKKTWDMIATILPDLGRQANESQGSNAAVFRYAVQQKQYADLMEMWVWQMGALSGLAHPLTMTMLNEGYSFGEDVHEPARAAAAKYRGFELAAQSQE